MQKYPQARAEEFKQLIKLAEIQPNLTIADVPAGGGYLANYLDVQTKLIAMETCPSFASLSARDKNCSTVLCDSLERIPKESQSVDRIVSLAGLHHIDALLPVLREFYRLLSPKGLLCIADVYDDSKVAQFLDVFVARYSSGGHQGNFITRQTDSDLIKTGFNILFCRPIEYYWRFDSQQNMIEYCQLLFGLDLATLQEVLSGIENYLGYEVIDGQYCLNWQLWFYKCAK